MENLQKFIWDKNLETFDGKVYLFKIIKKKKLSL